jgi:hypothetical protein
MPHVPLPSPYIDGNLIVRSAALHGAGTLFVVCTKRILWNFAVGVEIYRALYLEQRCAARNRSEMLTVAIHCVFGRKIPFEMQCFWIKLVPDPHHSR